MFSREYIRELLLRNLKFNKPIIGVAVGSGLAAKQAFAGGADFILALNAGRFRNAGVSSMAALMPFANSNAMVLNFGVKEIMPRVKNKLVFFGACASDPMLNHDKLLQKIKRSGFCGVNNFPTVGLIDGTLRQALEENGLGFQREVEFMEKAVKNELFTVAFVFNEEQAKLMTEVGVDIICAHLGFTAGGLIGAKHVISIENGVKLVNRIFKTVDQIHANQIKLVYGGPISTPCEAEIFYDCTGAEGYIGGSSFERIPTEETIKKVTGQFKNIVKLRKEYECLKRELIKKKVFDEMVGQSRIMQELFELVSKVADKDINVLVVGESGTGKELIVKAIHYNSSRYKQPFIKVNCAAIPEHLLESELFGHEKGAFTGAIQKRLGLFELANKGTLFLDEIGEMSMSIQAKLLRVIQQQEFQRVGGSETIKVDVRIVCATNKDLENAVNQGEFREDLYYRLNVFTLRTPPLREHKEDIPLLTNYFLEKVNQKFKRYIRRLSVETMDILMQYDWPGNVRELEHLLESAAIISEGDIITVKDLPLSIQRRFSTAEETDNSDKPQTYKAVAASMERQFIIDALNQYGWNRQKTANFLGMNRRTLWNKIKKYNLQQKS